MNVLIVDATVDIVRVSEKAISGLPFINKIEYALNYEQARKMSQTGHFDCYIIEAYLSHSAHGLDLVKSIKREQKDSLIIVITGFPDKHLIENAFNSGADEYIKKDVIRYELRHRLSKIYELRSGSMQTCTATTYGDLKYTSRSHSFEYKGKPLFLSKGQKELLVVFVLNANRLISHHELRAKLWGDDYSDTFCKKRNLPERIYELKKALPLPLGEKIQSVRGEGYLFQSD